MNEVPDQPLNPPESYWDRVTPTYWDYLEHEADRLNDEAKCNEDLTK
jgi:hypothetical protein